jgi:hypothetical protein
MITIVGEITSEVLTLDATSNILGFKRRIQTEKTIDGGVVCIDYGEDIAGAELVIEAQETESADALKAMDRICRENEWVYVSTPGGYFRGIPRESENGKMTIIIEERRA